MSTTMVLLWMLMACDGAADAGRSASVSEPLPDELPGGTEAADHLVAAEGRAPAMPTPLEVQTAVHNQGMVMALGSVAPVWNFRLDAKEPDRVAVRVGVQIADLVLDAETAPLDDMRARLIQIRDGLDVLGVDPKVSKGLHEVVAAIDAGAVDRTVLVRDLDAFAGEGVAEMDFTERDTLLPLIQAGVWLEGTYLVAEACKVSGNPKPANQVLKQVEVVDYFRTHAEKVVGAGRLDAGTAQTLLTGLIGLDALARKETPYTLGDVSAISQAADSILSSL